MVLQAFHQRHYWSAQLGHAICLGLSTTRFRSNKDSVHEVHIDQEQIDWFRRQLQAAKGHPVIVFTHAPPMGSGLKTVEASPSSALNNFARRSGPERY